MKAIHAAFGLGVAVLFAACGNDSVRDGQDGGTGGSGGGQDGGPGGGAGGGGGPACAPGERICDGTRVRACGAGGKAEGPVIEECAGAGGACSTGRCLSAPCADVELKRSYLGCLFYAVDADNTPFDDPQRFTIVIGNPDAVLTANVRIERKTSGAWMAAMTSVVPPGSMQAIPLGDSHGEGAGVFKGAAFRIASDAPIAAYAFNSDDQIEPKSESSGATLLVPAHVLGRSHLALGARMPAASVTPKSGASPAQILVVGAQDGTRVTVTPRAALRAGAGGMPAVAKGMPYVVTLDEGDLLQAQNAIEGDDLTGSDIQSDRPVAVFSGNVCADDGHGLGAGSDPCDMTFEQMLPVEAWGKTYVAGRAVPQGTSSCSKWDLPTLWRVLASENATTVTFDKAAGVPGVPDVPVKLDRGQFHELAVGGTLARPGDFFVSADKPIMLAQYVPCEPSLGLGVATEQMLTDFTFFAPSFFSNQLAITRRAGAPVTFDGKPLPDSMFVPAGGGYEVARVIADACLAGSPASCTHRIAGSAIGVTVRGMDGFCSYLYIGGMSVKCVNKTVGCR